MHHENAPFRGLWIGGVPSSSSDDITFPIVNPANGETIALVAEGTEKDIDRAVSTAKNAYETVWRMTTPRDRAETLHRLAALMRENAEELAQIETRNVGKPISSARGEVLYAARVYDYYAGVLPTFGGQTFPLSAAGTGFTLRESLGVCGLIVPWNFPLVILAWKLAPALAMGNTAVVKPAEWTPLSALRLAELAQEAGLPDGVLNVVPGLGSVAGAALAQHPDVRKISFTGSTVTGSKVMQMAAQTIKRVSLELGGKSACLVFADADLDKAANTVMSVFDNTGQDCCARSRYFVQREVFDDFVAKFVANAQAIRIGDPLLEETEMGPLVSSAHRERVHGLVTQGKAEGAECVIGGSPLEGDGFAHGYYYAPTVCINASEENVLSQKEVFGPVVTMTPFDTEEDAIRLANATPYGLSGSIWTRDTGRALRLVRAVEAGVLSVNSSSSVHLEMPFGGYKQSGFGRELGVAALEHYSEIKSVFMAEA